MQPVDTVNRVKASVVSADNAYTVEGSTISVRELLRLL